MQELQSFPPFRRVPPAALDELFSQCKRVQLASGEVVYRQGDEAADALLLLQGALTLTVRGGSARERLVGEVRPGELAGEQALFAPGSRRSASVTASEPSLALRIPRSTLARAGASPAVAALEAHMLRVLTQRVRGNDTAIKRVWLEELERMPAEARPPGLLDRLRAWLGAS